MVAGRGLPGTEAIPAMPSSSKTFYSSIAAANASCNTAASLCLQTVALAVSGGGGFGGSGNVASPRALSSRPIQRRSDASLRIIKLRNAWYTLPSVARYFVSGNMGNIIFYVLHQHVLSTVILPKLFALLSDDTQQSSGQQALIFSWKIAAGNALRSNLLSISFFLSYLFQIIPQHFLNAVLVFGWDKINTRTKYWKSLYLTYTTYLATLCGSTLVNAILLKRTGVSNVIAFWISVYGFAIVNYIILKSHESAPELPHVTKTSKRTYHFTKKRRRPRSS